MKRALAHGTHTDEGISAQMHIDPNDHPVVGHEAKFYFTFQDSSGQLQLQQCDCTVTILKDEQEIETQTIIVSDSAFASLGSAPLYKKTFTESGPYELILKGNPKVGIVFQPFELTYDILVQDHSSQMADKHIFASEHLGHILIFGSGFAIAIIILIRNYLKNRKQNN